MTIIVVCSFFLLILIGFDVGFAMIAAALLGMVTHQYPVDPVTIPLTATNAIDASAYLTIPLFILAGELMNRGGVTQRLIAWSSAMVGHLRGSLAQISVMTNLAMSGITGSPVAEATATGSALIPQMVREGYRGGFAAAVIAASAMLGAILPPSIPMLIYAAIANVSVIKLFLAGIVPGLLLTAGYMGVCALVSRRHGYPAKRKATWKERASITRSSAWALAMPLLVLLGIRSGATTITESAALIVLYALFIGLFIYKSLAWRDLLPICADTSKTSAVILFLLAAAGPFSWLMSELGIAQQISSMVLGASGNPYITLLIVNVILLLIGKVLEPVPALIMFTPTLLPIQAELGIDPIQFGTMVVLNLMIGMQSPPVGLLLFTTSAIGQVPIGRVMLAVLPFVGWSLVVLGLVSTIPAITLALGGPLFH